MPESAEEIYARVVAAVGADGRLPMPPVHEWDMFPWEIVEGELQPKVVRPPLEAEAERSGAGGVDCHLCDGGGDATRIWENWSFHVKRPPAPSGLPLILWLNANEHLDFTDLSDDQAAEFGRLSVWLARIMTNLPNVGRVHVNRWGDGSEDMHAWFIARPARLPGIIGSLAVEWDEMLPPGPEDLWLAETEEVAASWPSTTVTPSSDKTPRPGTSRRQNNADRALHVVTWGFPAGSGRLVARQDRTKCRSASLRPHEVPGRRSFGQSSAPGV